ncbi:hypothetical protein D9M72_373790 [compost metagenome]
MHAEAVGLARCIPARGEQRGTTDGRRVGTVGHGQQPRTLLQHIVEEHGRARLVVLAQRGHERGVGPVGGARQQRKALARPCVAPVDAVAIVGGEQVAAAHVQLQVEGAEVGGQGQRAQPAPALDLRGARGHAEGELLGAVSIAGDDVPKHRFLFPLHVADVEERALLLGHGTAEHALLEEGDAALVEPARSRRGAAHRHGKRAVLSELHTCP